MRRKPLGSATNEDAPIVGSCAGRGMAFAHDKHPDPHPSGIRAWGACWRCRSSLGCSTCTTANPLEVLCRRCGAWGTREAFLWHGPIVGESGQRRAVTPFHEYPEKWRTHYEAPEPYEPKSITEIMAILGAVKGIPEMPKRGIPELKLVDE